MTSPVWEPTKFSFPFVSTRQATVDGKLVKFELEALDGMIEQIRTGFIPWGAEHLDYIPPLGRLKDGEIVEADDGSQVLMVDVETLPHYEPAGPDVDLFGMLPADRSSSEPPEDVYSFSLGLEPRSYEDAVFEDLVAEAPLPVERIARWSSLPPIEIMIVIGVGPAVAWGAAKFAGAFFEQLGKAAADAFIGWLRKAMNRSKEPERDRLISLRFDLPGNVFISGHIPVYRDDPDHEAALEQGLSQSAALAELVEFQVEREVMPNLKRAAFFFAAGRWNLAWWTDGERVHVSNWFRAHAPDPVRFLGYPLLDDPDLFRRLFGVGETRPDEDNE